MQSQFTLIFYYSGLFISVVFLSKFIYEGYIRFLTKFNLTKDFITSTSKKIKIYYSTGVVFSISLLVASVSLDNLDFVDFKNISPEIGTSILIAFFGVYKDFLKVSNFQKYILLSFLISMLVYSSAVNGTILNNFNGFLGVYDLSPIVSFIVTFLIYVMIINAVSRMQRISGYNIIFGIMFFVSLKSTYHLNYYHQMPINQPNDRIYFEFQYLTLILIIFCHHPLIQLHLL